MNRLNEIEARANAATEGPWEAFGTVIDAITGPGDCRGCSGILSPAHEPACYYSEIAGAGEQDAEFIAHARTDVPDMAAALRAVLEIHQDGGESQGYLDDGSYGDLPNCCTECGSLGEYGVPYPCPTVTAIRQHIGDDL